MSIQFGLQLPLIVPAPSILEVCVEALNRAVAAERGGADRIEFCNDLYSGGVTPSAEAMQAARRQIQIPLYVLIRPRAGDFLYNDGELNEMRRDIAIAKELGMDGIVLGILNERGEVDREGTRMLVELARPLPVTFHRAFDLCHDLNASLEAVIETGATRLLTAGGKNGVSNGLSHLTRLIEMAGERIVIMPGGGIRASNIQRILSETGAKEIHTSLSRPRQCTNHSHESMEKIRGTPDRDAKEFETRVRSFRRLLDTWSAAPSAAE